MSEWCVVGDMFTWHVRVVYSSGWHVYLTCHSGVLWVTCLLDMSEWCVVGDMFTW